MSFQFPLAALAVPLLACAAPDVPAERPYCNMNAFTPATLARHLALTPKLAAAITARRELDDGYELTFGGAFREAGEWLDGVRHCCPTIAYAVAFAPHDGAATLRITGAGARPFIREEFHQLIDR